MRTITSWLISIPEEFSTVDSDSNGDEVTVESRQSSRQLSRRHDIHSSSSFNRGSHNSNRRTNSQSYAGPSCIVSGFRHDTQSMIRDMQRLTLNTTTSESNLGSRGYSLVESPVATSPSPISDSTPSFTTARSSTTLSRELRLRNRSVIVPDLSNELQFIETKVMKGGMGGFGEVRKGRLALDKHKDIVVAIKSIKSYESKLANGTKVQHDLLENPCEGEKVDLNCCLS